MAKKYKVKKAQAGIPGQKRYVSEDEIIPGVNAPLEEFQPWTTPAPMNPLIEGRQKGIIENSRNQDQGYRYDPSINRAYEMTPDFRISRQQQNINRFFGDPLKAANTAMVGATGIANLISNNKLKNKERLQVMQSLEPTYWDNMEAEGLNNLPMYTKYGGKVKCVAGGGPSQEKAKEMLRDGTANGKKLTKKQKGYFGWIAGGKKQTGGSIVIPEIYKKDVEAWKDRDLKNLTPQGLESEKLRLSKMLGPNSGNSIIALKVAIINEELQKRSGQGLIDRLSSEGMPTGGMFQTGGGKRLQPIQMQEWNQFLDFVKEKGYEGSEELNKKSKNLGASLFSEFKAANPNVSITYDIVPDVQNEMQILKDSTQSFLKRKKLPGSDTVMEGISPVDNWFGSKTSQFRFPAATLVTKNNGVVTGQSELGLVDSSLKATGAGAVKKGPPKGVKIETLYDESGNAYGTGYEDPVTGDVVQLKYGGMLGKKVRYQVGGGEDIPVVQGLPDDLEKYANVEAEAGEILQMRNGRIVKVSDNANTHEQGGEDFAGVSRVLEDTSDKRKDKASKGLCVYPEDAAGLLGLDINHKVTHAKAFELATDKLEKKEKEYQKAKKNANLKDEIDVTTNRTLQLNEKFKSQMPTTNDIFEVLFQHQEDVKNDLGIKDDGSMKKGKYKTGGRNFSSNSAYKKWLAYGHATGEFERTPGNQKVKIKGKKHAVKHAQAGIESPGFSRPPRTSKQGEWYFDEGTKKWYKQGTVPVGNAAPQPAAGLSPYTGGRTAAGRTTPTGNPNAFNFPGGLDAFKKAWSPILNLDQYGTVQEAQAAAYDYLVNKEPDVASSIWQSQGLTSKGIDMRNPKSGQYNPGFANVADQLFDPKGRLKEGVNLTPEQLAALQPAYADNMLGIRAVTPSQFTTNETGYPTTVPPPAPGAPARNTNTGVTINPNFRTQPQNDFYEPTYWSDIAAPTVAFADAMRRDPELYNPVDFNQLRLKLKDPTATLNANQADFNAATDALGNMQLGSGAQASNVASLLGQKYRVNNQVLSQYDNENQGTKNQEIIYNTGVRDRQSVANAKSREEYYRNVQLARENQRLQKLTSLTDLSRVDQMKRRQNRSGNLIQKLSPAFDQYGEYNGYQYVPILPPELGIGYDLGNGPAAAAPTSRTSTTTTYRTADGRVIKKRVS